MSLSCSLQVIDFSNFYLEKETKLKGLSLDHSDYWHLLILPVHDTIFTLFSIYLFNLFFGGGRGVGKIKNGLFQKNPHPHDGRRMLENLTRGGVNGSGNPDERGALNLKIHPWG